MRHVRHPSPLAALVLIGGLFGCAADATHGAPLDPSGTYRATGFTIVFEGDTLDELSAGVTLTLTLAPDGTTVGSLFVPEAETEPVALRGTWHHDGAAVTFSQTPESFLDHLTFQWSGDELHAVGTVGPGDFSVTLAR